MVDHREGHPPDWITYFARHGHPGAEPLAAGAEGTVYRLGGGLVAKVWNGRPPADLPLTREVHEDLARHRLPFATPRIVGLDEHQGTTVTYERELVGSPLRPDSAIDPPPRDLVPGEVDALLTVLRGLARVPGSEAMRRLVVAGDDRPLWQGHTRFPDALAALVERATARHRDLLAAHVPALGDTVGWALRALRALPDPPVTVVHGDLVPPNIHVGPDGRPTAVLDFGFFTTAGDPAFEAAVAAAVWDMYGPYAEEHVTALTHRLATALGHDPRVLALYQAAYALTTYDLFATDGEDGHFRWCAALLNRTADDRTAR